MDAPDVTTIKLLPGGMETLGKSTNWKEAEHQSHYSGWNHQDPCIRRMGQMMTCWVDTSGSWDLMRRSRRKKKSRRSMCQKDKSQHGVCYTLKDHMADINRTHQELDKSGLRGIYCRWLQKNRHCRRAEPEGRGQGPPQHPGPQRQRKREKKRKIPQKDWFHNNKTPCGWVLSTTYGKDGNKPTSGSSSSAVLKMPSANKNTIRLHCSQPSNFSFPPGPITWKHNWPLNH